jgi:hypothetical protein
MTETTGREGGNFASEIPSRNLPPVEYRDLPEPKKLRNIVGASVIILATAIGSGEFVLWPYITSQIGLVFIWGAIVGFLIQYFINMEIERYTLATGETAITGFARFWKPWWWLFIIFVAFQNFWPGWATGASTTLSYIFGFGGNAITYLTVAALIAIGLALTTSPVVYQTVEKVQGAMVIAIMAFVLVAVFIGTTAEGWGALFSEGVAQATLPIGQGELGVALLLGALAFAGAGGANNLVQSNYIRDKGMGMGLRIPRVVSPVTGEEEASEGIGFMFPQDEANMRRWKEWWRIANIEQFVTFFVIGVLSLIVFAVLTRSTVPVGATEAQDLEFIRVEGEALRDIVGPGFGIAFWAAGTFALFSTNLGIVDYTCRLIADQLNTNATRDSEFWTESKLYFTFVWLMVVLGSVILLGGFNQPLVLLIISSSIAGLQMFIYSGLLILLNRRALPEGVRITSYRLVVMWISFAFFGFFSVILVYTVLKDNLFGG